ncbi:MFS transporter [Acidipropionibacterium virtanenii]|uniref:Major myo-inositol transporter IolT n=1 Tax=Acidipropionibacterium virtanenii TaxID=2057246 RepID=A0A344UTE9_9ACTN|nr:MFS transporter [Acidipropionibacterium virtanenii]AXE38547.1 Major myo-inositol transporter IolT [Acidipropionibacterium virtanenii]
MTNLTNTNQRIGLDEIDGVVEKTKASGTKRKIGFVAFVATLGSFLFGYDTGVISGALPYMYMPHAAGGLNLTAAEEGWVGGTLLLGAALGALIGGRLSDRYGRRHNILMLAAIFFIGAVGTAASPSVWVMYPFRAILGFAVGGASATVPVYLSETAPKRIRGTIVAVDQVMILTGQLLAYTFNAVINTSLKGPRLTIESDPGGLLRPGNQSFDNVNALAANHGGTLAVHDWYQYIANLVVSGGNGSGWRLMLIIASIPAIALWMGMRLMPESPRWYANNKRYYEAVGALKRVRDPQKDGDIGDELRDMVIAHQTEVNVRKGTFKDIFTTPWLRKLFLVGCFLAITNQTTGVNTVMYYAPKVLQYAGLGTSASITAQVAIGVTGVLGGLIGLSLMSRLSRRPILITCLFAAFVSLGVIATLFHFTIQPALDSHGTPPGWAPFVILAMMGVFMLIVNGGNGPVVWTMLGEMFPASVRGIANGTAVFVLWVTNAIITFTFPSMMESLGGARTYGIYALINLVFACILIKIMPETSGRSLEQIEVDMKARFS